MMFLKSVAGRFCRQAGRVSRVHVEGLESRQLLSAGPVLTGVKLEGPVGGVNAVVLSFNESLNTAKAQDPQAFLFGKPTPPGSDNGFDLGNLLFLSVARPKLVKAGKIQFASAVYNDAAHTVTLTPLAPFRAQAFFRVLRIRGTGAHALTDAAGSTINGGADEVLNWSIRQGKQVQYVDSQKNRITLKLRGRGNVFVFLRKRADADPVIFIDSTNSASVLTATVRRAGKPGGVTQVAEVNASPALANVLTSNPNFQVQSAWTGMAASGDAIGLPTLNSHSRTGAVA
ncbi:MAG TPA: hypothetical protein VFC78_06325 [Tepidisphaeraceae bacterium]|nr:hypothetical protein [Tepidisphaeraceae bacterium]